MSVLIKLRRGSASDWLTQNVVLASGEPGLEIDTGRLKIGNGSLSWNSLPYASIIPSGFIPGSGININLGTNGSNATISVSGLNSSYISDFNEAVDDRVGSGLFVAGTGVNLNYNDSGNTFTVSVSGLINNPANNRILTSRDNTTTGIDAESNATFDGTTLAVSGSITVDNLKLDGNTLSSTNSDGNIIIQPSGTGALQRDIGGNARGDYAVDWQAVRSSGAMVAGGDYSVIGGGNDNTSSSYASTVGGGKGNTSSGSYSTVAGGYVNTINSSAIGSSVGGGRGNTISGYYCTVGGGLDNNISGDTGNTIGGGNNNTASNSYNTVGGGRNNTSSNLYCTVCGGKDNTSSGQYSVVGAGKENTSSGHYSAILGGQSNNANHSNVFILGSNITSTQANTTYVQNLDVAVSGDIGTLKIDNFYHQNLAVATGIADNDLLIAIVDPTGSPTTEVIQGSVLRSSLLSQPAQLQFRQGTNTQRLLITPASGEPIWTTDSQKFYIGDGTTVGGDFVGPSPYDRSVGVQSISALNTDCVASGDYSVIGGGLNNKIHSNLHYSVICGGSGNTVSGNTFGHEKVASVICGGYDNTISSDYNLQNAIVCGANNTISHMYGGFIGGGFNNTIASQTFTADGCCIVGGLSNTNNGFASCSILGGQDNTIDVGVNYSTVCGGRSNIIGIDSHYNTIIGGTQTKSKLYGEIAHAAGGFSSVAGTSQHSVLVARRATTNATANQVLFLDGSSARLTLPAETTWTFTVKLSAYNDTDNQGGWWIFRGGIRRNAASGTVLIGSLITESGFESSFNTASTSVVANDTNETLEIRVTGVASKNIRWVAVVDISQVSYGTP